MTPPKEIGKINPLPSPAIPAEGDGSGIPNFNPRPVAKGPVFQARGAVKSDAERALRLLSNCWGELSAEFGSFFKQFDIFKDGERKPAPANQTKQGLEPGIWDPFLPLLCAGTRFDDAACVHLLKKGLERLLSEPPEIDCQMNKVNGEPGVICSPS